ncbi:CotH kinase family protein [Rubrivirga sp.]|uniref:CotH kinase family protein n=1 Tax=Rubrivirga sp. TaxID=1885344 RepID=UPI003C77F5A2
MAPFLRAAIVLVACSLATARAQSETSTRSVFEIRTEDGSIPDEPKIMARLRVLEGGVQSVLEVAAYDGWIGIEQRGSSSSRFPKKQYAVETRNEDGSNRDVSLLGLPTDNDWVLHAPYSDKSLMRNALAFHLGHLTDRYASRFRFLEVVLDGDYQGVYVLLESIKDDGDRVDLADTDSLAGGYIAKLDKRTGGGETWPSRDPATGQFVRYQFHDPEADELTGAQRDEIEVTFDAMEEATVGDLEDAIGTYLDLDSFVDYVIVSEVAKNIDAYRISTYVHRPAAGAPLHAGPLWDYNLAFGNADYGGAAGTDGFQYATPYTSDTYPIPSWFSRLVESDTFQTRARDRWTELRRGPFATDSLLAWIDATAAELEDAQARNFERWPILDEDVWPNAFVGGSYVAEVGYLKDWLTERLAWLDGEWLATPTAERRADLEDGAEGP